MTMRQLSAFLLLALVAVLLVPGCAGEPSQCQVLRNVIRNCSCEGAYINNTLDNLKVVINCKGRQLTHVPTVYNGGSTYEIFEMTLAENNLQSIPANAFNGLRIRRLELRENRLTSIDVNAFRGLESYLGELHIGGDKGAVSTNTTRTLMDSLRNLTNLHTLTLEYFRFDKNELLQGNLVHFDSLETLTLRYNALTFIEALSVPQHISTLVLDHQALEVSPISVFQAHTDLTSLTITNTNISGLTDFAFDKNTKLTHLDMSYNRISVLHADCFKGLESSLVYLSLRNNPVNSVNVLNSIRALTRLQTLQLSEVNLRTLLSPPPFLENKAFLSNLYLDGNQLTTIGANIFGKVGGSLTTLSLSHNQITSMNDHALANLTALKILDLTHQTIQPGQSLVLPASFAQIGMLQNLDLTGTPVKEDVLWQRVPSLTNLHVLKLSSTGLTVVSDFALQYLTQLSELDLDSNNISAITQEKFTGPRGLTKLHLNNNQIQTISNCAFHLYQFNPALEVNLIRNLLTCDCRLRWLLELTAAGKIKLSGFESCAAPPDKAGQLLSLLKPENLTCDSALMLDTCKDLIPPSTTTATPPKPIISITVTNITRITIKITWLMENTDNINYLRVRVTELGQSSSISGQLEKTTTSYTANDLSSGKSYSLCVLPFSSSGAIQDSNQCVSATTLASGDSSPVDTDDSSNETSIIVGTVVAAVILLVVLAAILYLVFLRKRTKKPDMPQPHIFAPSELPSMGAEAKRFTHPKKQQQPPKVGRAMEVAAISDGQTSPSGRISAGSYQYLDMKHVQPFPDVKPSTSYYSNDVKGRDLPPYPGNSSNGDADYYKMGADAEPANHHTYNEINK